MSPGPDAPIPAATLILIREGAGAPELLMVERAATLRFAGGAAVFPGGRIDPGDLLLADGDETRAAQVAAIRETLEETGIAVAIEPLPSPALTAALRETLHAGESFPDLVAAHSLALATDRLVPFARWRPDHGVSRVFDTHFFLAAAPAGLPAPSIDDGEVVRAFWTSAAALLAAADRGEARLIFPTRRNLERLARFGSFADAVADAVAHPVAAITPWVEPRNGAPHLCIPEGIGYPVTAEPLARVERG